MNNFLENNWDNLGFLIICLFIGISFSFLIYNESKKEDEKECFLYYSSNGYILDKCEVYRDKLEKIESKEE